MVGKQDEIQGVTEVAVVLSDVPKTVQRRERIQVSHDLGVSSETASAVRGKSGQISSRIQSGLPEGFQRNLETAVQPEESPGQCRLPAVYQRQESCPYERHLLGHPDLLCETPGQDWDVRDRGVREGLVHYMDSEGSGGGVEREESSQKREDGKR